MQLEIPTLTGRLVRLEALSDHHVAGLVAAAGEDRSRYGFTAVLMAATERGDVVAFVQRSVATGREVGMTRYLTIRRGDGAAPWAVEIGGTWLSASAQGSGINVEAKFLLLAHAFDAWPVERVDFKTDARNERSRHALAALGAVFEGTLRAWQPSFVAGEEGRMRDSAMFSILRREWPEVRERLAHRIDLAVASREAAGAIGGE